MASKRNLRRHLEQRHQRPSWQHGFNPKKCCDDKRRWSSREEAEFEMNRLEHASYHTGGVLNAYLCPITRDHFHFGHLPNMKKRGFYERCRSQA